jgi:hypothetical protein
MYRKVAKSHAHARLFSDRDLYTEESKDVRVFFNERVLINAFDATGGGCWITIDCKNAVAFGDFFNV